MTNSLTAIQKIKTRVRLAKVLLRGVSFSCSLIVLALVASTFSIFNATRGLAQKNSFTPWAPNTPVWPQILVLCIAAVSLLFSIGVLYGYCRGGHKRAEKVAVYYTVFSVMVFIVTLVMWVVGAAVLQNSRNSSSNKDIWGWACNPGTRRDIYQDQVDYELICRMQVSICSIRDLTNKNIQSTNFLSRIGPLYAVSLRLSLKCLSSASTLWSSTASTPSASYANLWTCVTKHAPIFTSPICEASLPQIPRGFQSIIQGRHR